MEEEVHTLSMSVQVFLQAKNARYTSNMQQYGDDADMNAKFLLFQKMNQASENSMMITLNMSFMKALADMLLYESQRLEFDGHLWTMDLPIPFQIQVENDTLTQGTVLQALFDLMGDRNDDVFFIDGYQAMKVRHDFENPPFIDSDIIYDLFELLQPFVDNEDDLNDVKIVVSKKVKA